MTALLTILTSKPMIRTNIYADGRTFAVSRRFFCDQETCPYSAHQHFEFFSAGVLPLDESSWVGDWQYLPYQPELPFEDDELELADDAYAIVAGK